ncbi:MAG: ATP-binding cassette domain-containing protein [Deltaproteobacteria bacterium]|nr:ATP-binding cassette domain-containing protein [Deltaproteobacteria bacterium]
MTTASLRAVTVDFGNGRGLRELNLELDQGQRVALLGASGAGKSTLLRVLATALPAQAGTVEILGTPTRGLWGAALRRLRREVGLMTQADNLVEGLSVFHNVTMANLGRWSTFRSLTALAWPRRADVAAARQALARVELETRLWDWPQHLSGGERQRVALARLRLQSPRLWLADEPTAGLDPRLRRALLTRLLAEVREAEATVVVSVDDVALIDEGFDRVVGLRDGQVVFDGLPREADAATLSEIYAA